MSPSAARTRWKFATTTETITTAKLSIRVLTTTIHPPVGKARRYSALTLTVIEARERGMPKDREPIHWKLVTNMPVPDLALAIQMLDWYSLRWKIEMYHKVLKSGCQAEQSKLRTAERLINLLAVQCVVGWRVFWLTMMNRTHPETPAENAFTPDEIAILHQGRFAEAIETLTPIEPASRKAFVGLERRRVSMLVMTLG